MSPKALKIALAASVAVNLFAIAGVGSVWAMLKREEAREVSAQVRLDGRDRRDGPMDVVARLSPEGRELVRESLRARALSARPDFEEARQRRAQAITAASTEPYDGARVKLLLDQSRAAERRGRDQLEAETIRLLGALSPADRRVAAELLNRRGKGGPDRRGGSDRRDVPPPPPPN